jgi:hypothetical protein
MTYLCSLDTETKMKEDETFDEFYAQLHNIVNLSFNLGEKIANKKIVRKILMSLPKRFRLKVTTIEESKDVDVMKVEELVGFLATYDYKISLPWPKK